ncbi:MAG: peptidylprolyl isomerase [Bacteroidota bacterium]
MSLAKTPIFLGFYSLIIIGLLSSCASSPTTPEAEAVPQLSPDVIIHTDNGIIKIQLFDETPLHKANFLRLARSGFFDSLSFNRIIRDFVIQTGDPRYDNGGIYPDRPSGPPYTLVPEFREELVHTRGMIGAAREPDDKNPDKRSSSSQFYIVVGKPQSPEALRMMETEWGIPFRKGKFYERFQQALSDSSFAGSFTDFLKEEAYQDFRYPPEQVDLYLNQGGTPNLDFNYTIFGQVLEGMEVVQEISEIPTRAEQPMDTVRVLRMEVLTQAFMARPSPSNSTPAQ